MRTETYEVIPSLMAEDATPVEVQSDFGEVIVKESNAQRSSEGFADHAHGPVKERATEQQGWRDAFLDAIEQSKPLTTDKERQQLDEARARQLEREEQEAENEEETEESQEEVEQAVSNPLDQFDDASVKEWAEYLGLNPDEDLANPKIAAMLASRMQEAVDADTAEAQRASQAQGTQPGQYQPTQQEFDAYVQELHKAVDNPQINDPVMMKAFTTSLGQFLGADTPEAQQNVEGLSRVLTAGGLNLMGSVVPMMISHCLPAMLDQAMPGLREMMADANNANAWESARAEVSRELPDLDSPAFEELKAAVCQKAPWITSIQWKDANGRPLHPSDPRAVRQQALAFARVAMGERVSPEALQKAIETGKKEAAGSARRVSASRVLKSGRSTGSQFAAQHKDSFREAIFDYNASQRSGEREE